MRTPVTAIQTTSLHWQRSVPGKRSRGEKVKTKKSRNLKGILRGKVIAFAVYMLVARIKRNEL